MSDDLVRRAREAAAHAPNREFLFTVADRIEALEAENESLRGALVCLRDIDWEAVLPDRVARVNNIARAALKDVDT